MTLFWFLFLCLQVIPFPPPETGMIYQPEDENSISFQSEFMAYNPRLPFTLKFPGPEFCSGNGDIMMVVGTYPIVRLVIQTNIKQSVTYNFRKRRSHLKWYLQQMVLMRLTMSVWISRMRWSKDGLCLKMLLKKYLVLLEMDPALILMSLLFSGNSLKLLFTDNYGQYNFYTDLDVILMAGCSKWTLMIHIHTSSTSLAPNLCRVSNSQDMDSLVSLVLDPEVSINKHLDKHYSLVASVCFRFDCCSRGWLQPDLCLSWGAGFWPWLVCYSLCLHDLSG